MLRISKETLQKAKYMKRGKNSNKSKFSIQDDLQREPEGNILGYVRGRLDSRNLYGIYNRANPEDSSSSGIGDSGSHNYEDSDDYNYFDLTMPESPDSE